MNPRYPKPAACAACSLEHAGFGFVRPSGPSDARLRFIGESAGYEEALHGEPFYGAAGGVLSRILMRAGVDRRNVAIGNVVSCRPPGDFLAGASYEEHAISQCRQYLQPVLDATPDNGVVVTLGGTALQSVLNLRGVAGINVKDWHSCVQRDPSDRFWVVPTFHPSHLQRGAMSLLEVVTQDIQLADRIAQRGFVRSPVELVVDPHPDWLRKWITDYLAKLLDNPESVHLAIDTEFAEKAGGADESEVVLGSVRSPITRVNGACDGTVGWTVPYREPFIGLLRGLFESVTTMRGWIWMWNKYADLDHLWADGHQIPNEIVIDAMWGFHFLQSDLPRGLGFVAPMASDFGAWKHWSKIPSREGEYAAADGVQTWRTSMWILKALIKQNIWDRFLWDWHERDCFVLRPAFVQGVCADRAALETFHAELQVKLQSVLERIKLTAAEGTLKPKGGYGARPVQRNCQTCGVNDVPASHNCIPKDRRSSQYIEAATGKVKKRKILPMIVEVEGKPPASILGKPKKGGGEAKSAYMTEGVRLVERTIEVTINCCETCGAEGVGVKHRCPKPKAPKRPRKTRTRDGSVADDVSPVGGSPERAANADSPSGDRPVPRIVKAARHQLRYFWQLPFNPDAPAQVLAYLASQGIAAPIDKKRQRATTNKKALGDLAKQHRDDPFFQLQLDWKAVQKVDSTYAVGALSRLDSNDMLHPEFLPKPSTFRDSCVGINLQNVVADKAGPDGLASGFRRCIVSRDGVPDNRSTEEIDQWRTRWD